MDTTGISFADLIRPLTPQRFFDEYWERKPFVGDGCERCTTLIGLSDIEHLISSLPYPRPGWLSLVKHARELPASAYTREDGFVSLQRVYDAFESGHTLQLSKLSRRWRPIERLARAVEGEFAAAGVILSRYVGSHLYLTPKNGVALAPHFDSHDVLVLHVAGEKRWLVYEAAEPLPLERQRGALKELGAPCLDKTLQPGDVMFVPRGWPHEAAASSKGSIHITLDLWPTTWCDLLCAALRDEPLARRALPIGRGLRSAGDVGTAEQRSILERIGSPTVLQRVAKSLAGRFVESLGVLPGDGLKAILEPQPLTEATQLVRRDGAIPHVHSDADRVRLLFPESAFSAARAAEPLFEFLEQRSRFTVRELPEPFTSAEKIALVRQLVREQFLTVVEEHSKDELREGARGQGETVR